MKAVVIDLDDTLFCEQQYVESGFHAVAKYISGCTVITEEDVYNQLLYQSNKYGRIMAFNRMMEYFRCSTPSIELLVHIYRNHTPNIKMYHKAEESLKKLRDKFKLAIVTDGCSEVQRKKVEALGVDKLVDDIEYCMDYNTPKPIRLPYEILSRNMRIDVKDMVVVGDDPYADMAAAASLNIPSIRVLTGRYSKVKSLKDASPEKTFGSFSGVVKYLLTKGDK